MRLETPSAMKDILYHPSRRIQRTEGELDVGVRCTWLANPVLCIPKSMQVAAFDL